jgi:hypothetical protein
VYRDPQRQITNQRKNNRRTSRIVGWRLLGGAPSSLGILPGEGFVPLNDYLDALPTDIDISVEAQMPGNVYSGAEWCKISVERTRRYLDRYHASKAK